VPWMIMLLRQGSSRWQEQCQGEQEGCGVFHLWGSLKLRKSQR
jgi:hypothetical protein